VPIFIGRGAPLANKTGHSERNFAALHDQAFEDVSPAQNPDFLIVHFDLVYDRADVGTPEQRLAAEHVLAHQADKGRNFTSPR
jgi:hypothetical protein